MAFSTCDFELMSRLATLYHKTNLNLLIKLIRKEYIKEKKYEIQRGLRMESLP